MNAFQELRRSMFGNAPSGPPARESAGEIVIIDDSRETVDSLRALLQPHFEIVSGASFDEVSAKIGPATKVALLDIKMAPVDGFESIKLLRERKRDMRVFFHSAYPGGGDEVRLARESEPAGYLVKGEFAADELIRLLRAVT